MGGQEDVRGEIAPGIDLQKQILDQMEFAPLSENPALMPTECFRI